MSDSHAAPAVGMGGESSADCRSTPRRRLVVTPVREKAGVRGGDFLRLYRNYWQYLCRDSSLVSNSNDAGRVPSVWCH